MSENERQDEKIIVIKEVWQQCAPNDGDKFTYVQIFNINDKIKDILKWSGKGFQSLRIEILEGEPNGQGKD